MDKELIEEAEKWLGFGERDCLELGADRILDLMLMVQLEHERLRGFGGRVEHDADLLVQVRKWTDIPMEEVGDYTSRELREMVRCGQRRFARLMHGKETGEQSVEN